VEERDAVSAIRLVLVLGANPEGGYMSTPPVYDMICSIGELIDKLSIENIKCARANHVVLDERRKPVADPVVIANMELLARTAGEQRVRLKNEINRRLDEAIRRGGISTAIEGRTYGV
jgi:hypothetical protein